MTWQADLEITPVAQFGDDRCGSASVQMILSTLGTDNTAPGVQHVFQESIENWNGPWQHGNPVGLAATINRYNAGRPGDKRPARPAFEYAVKRSAMPYEACATIVNALHDYAAPSAVIVFGSMHWLVVFGASGDGKPVDGSSYTLDGLWLVNPDNALFRDEKANAGKPGFAREHITYESFLYDYFDGSNDGRTDHDEPRWGYADGGQFIVVTRSDAQPRGRLELPLAEDALRQRLSIPDAVSEFLKSNTRDEFAGAEQKKPRTVIRLDRRSEKFFIVPFVKDKKVHVVRFDESGRYRGTAFDLPNAGQFDDRPEALSRAAEELKLNLSDEQLADVPLVWSPTERSASPYNPLYAFKMKEDTKYASLGGNIPDFGDSAAKDDLDAQVSEADVPSL